MSSFSSRVRGHLRSNVYGLLAIFIALSGTAVALPGRNTVDSGDIRNSQVKGPDVARDTLTGGDIKESTLLGFAAAGHTHDGVYAPSGHGHDSAYAPLGHSHDASYVNEGQPDSVTQPMVVNVERSVSLQLGAFHHCDDVAQAAYLDFVSGTDTAPDFQLAGTHGGPVEIAWDADAGNIDHNSDVCTQLTVPPDYASGGFMRMRAFKESDVGAGAESLLCRTNGSNIQAPLTQTTPSTVTCTPSGTWGPGDSLRLSIAASGGLDDKVILRTIEWVYNATG